MCSILLINASSLTIDLFACIINTNCGIINWKLLDTDTSGQGMAILWVHVPATTRSPRPSQRAFSHLLPVSRLRPPDSDAVSKVF